MKKVSFFSLFFLLGLSLSAQESYQFNVTDFPYTDVHLHSALKPFNSLDVCSYSIWEPINHNCEGKLSKLFVSSSKEVPRYSQCHFEGLMRGNVGLGFLSLTPLEKGMMHVRLLNEKKKGKGTMACVSGVEFDDMPCRKEQINYYEDLRANIAYVLEGEGQNYYMYGEPKQYEVAQSSEHLQSLLADEHKLAIVLNIEGGHSLGLSLEENDISQTEEYAELYLKNVDRMKGVLPLTEGGDDYLEHPVLSMNINHFFWNGLGGHARTFSGLQNFVFGGKKGVGEGLTPLGEKVIKKMLDQENGRRILVDVKHMSLDARLWYYNYLEELRAQGDTVGIISSHSTVAGCSIYDKAYSRKDNKAKNKNAYLNRWTISLADEDIRQIHQSKGIVGIMLDKYRLMGNKAKKAVGETVEGSAQRRKLYVQVIMANVFATVKAVNEPSAWDILALGSDFDGMIAPFECYASSADMPVLAQDIYAFLSEPEAIFDLFTKEEVEALMFDLSPEEILRKFMYENGRNFALRNLPKSQSEG
ncbi:membrane dipeptidase [Saprospira sp. CCB-QB6]|uniref:membrane dipeptidase n=1 Tax=Saprospira sp. CCB-QB6 TaxID=3023936 RepID=UPI00234953DF|nr:membrane dipeptidase [Saprospira sp. CCB-QB6]WCL80190.1 membrane dipeptidase [Saprospira sp. CCB-QB6]